MTNADITGSVTCEWPSASFSGAPRLWRRGRAAWRSTTGLVRTENQDAALFAANNHSNLVGGDVRPGTVVPGAAGFLLGVFDGVAGCSDGALASRNAMWIFAASRFDPTDPRASVMAAARAANYGLHHAALRRNHSLATTLTAGLVVDDRLVLAHVGDSRAYLYRDGELRQLTRDHTIEGALAANYVAEGASHEEAERRAKESGWGSALAMAIGSESDVDPDLVEVTLREGDVVFLVTDGVSGVVPERDIEFAVSLCGAHPMQRSGVDDVLELLVRAVNYRGASDNATAVVFAVDGWV